jgi:UTP-glucose-1-phosphate uridylyltransferase
MAGFLSIIGASLRTSREVGLTEALDLAAKQRILRATRVEDGEYYDVETYDRYLAALQSTLARPG